jgi:hypothetical protein
MRAWRTADGGLLVETARGEFHLFDAAFAIRGFWRDGGWSEREHHGGSSYEIVADTLVEHSWSENTDSREDGKNEQTEVRLRGLAPVDAPVARVTAALAEAERRAKEGAEADHRAAQARLESFRAALPDFEKLNALEFLWQYEDIRAEADATIVIRLKDGPVVWEDDTYKGYGKYLYPDLEKVLKQRYGKRFKGLTVDVHGTDYLSFNCE